jgi:hypothetical protein
LKPSTESFGFALKKLSEITSQPASSLACSHLIGKDCGFVDRDWERMTRGHICSECRQPGDGGRLYFHVGIRILVDLIQQAYHAQSPAGAPNGPRGQDVGTIIYFCTLRETLLNQLLIEAMKAKGHSNARIERLLKDNKLANQRFGELFHEVIGKKWPESVSELSTKLRSNFEPVSDLMIRAANQRNRFLHEGSAWLMTTEFSTQCINAVPAMVELFVGMHNEYSRYPFSGND